MKLLYTTRSPYAAKVRIVALERDIALEFIEIADLSKKTPELLASNPLGKIPALILDDGNHLFDSPVICQYLDTLGEREKLIPHKGPIRYQTLKIEALADGVCDAAVAIMMENNMRPEDKRMDAMISHHTAAIKRSLSYLNTDSDWRETEWNLGQIAVAATLGYLNFRMKHLDWESEFPTLASWYEKTLKAHQTVKQTLPSV